MVGSSVFIVVCINNLQEYSRFDAAAYHCIFDAKSSSYHKIIEVKLKDCNLILNDTNNSIKQILIQAQGELNHMLTKFYTLVNSRLVMQCYTFLHNVVSYFILNDFINNSEILRCCY